MANVVFSTKALSAVPPKPAGAGGAKPDSGVMVYVRTADGNDALAWVDERGRTVTESQHEILRAAACKWLCVVVKYAESDAFVVTACLTDKLKAGEDLWPIK